MTDRGGAGRSHILDHKSVASLQCVGKGVRALFPRARIGGKALAKAKMKIDQIDLFEINEAFAVVPMKFMKEMGVPEEKVNVNGGSIAMGHPLGATGAMILGTLIDELERRKLRYGLATLCVGGGMGIATIVERL